MSFGESQVTVIVLKQVTVGKDCDKGNDAEANHQSRDEYGQQGPFEHAAGCPSHKNSRAHPETDVLAD